MITWDKSLKICQDEAKDYSSESLQTFKEDLNYGYHYIQAEMGRAVTQKTKSALTVASKQYYQAPKDLIFPVSVTVTVGTITYPIDFEESQVNWDKLNVFPQTIVIPQKAFIRRSFGMNNIEIGFWPIPSSAGNTITLVYEASDKDCTTLAYTAGTVSLTNGSAVMTGTGTSFTSAMIGRWFCATAPVGDGLWYRVQSVDSPTQITLDQYYEGLSASGLSYQVAEAFNLPEEVQMLPVHFALQHYYSIKGNDSKELKNKNLFEDGLTKAKTRYANKGKSSTITRNYWNTDSSIPIHFPTGIAS